MIKHVLLYNIPYISSRKEETTDNHKVTKNIENTGKDWKKQSVRK